MTGSLIREASPHVLGLRTRGVASGPPFREQGVEATNLVMAVAPRDASTVLPLRDSGSAVEVFMLKRDSRLGFFGGVHVFPGGAVDEADGAPAAAEMMTGWDDSLADSLVGVAEPARARGFLVAAVRELFEEAGILLARGDGGAWVDLEEQSPRARRLVAARPRLAGGEVSLAELMGAEGLTLATDSLAPFAHWITPESQKKRFDTRFFLARAPSCQSAEHDNTESTEGAWTSAAAAIERYRAREIELLPPTLISLERVLPYASVEEALEGARGEPVVTVMPRIASRDDTLTMLYPGDADYESGEAGDPADGRTIDRLLLRDGLWERP